MDAMTDLLVLLLFLSALYTCLGLLALVVDRGSAMLAARRRRAAAAVFTPVRSRSRSSRRRFLPAAAPARRLSLAR